MSVFNTDDGSELNSDDFYTISMRKMVEETLPLLQNFPPQIPNDITGLLTGSIDLVLYRNLASALEFCFIDAHSSLTQEQLMKLASFCRRRIIPAYLKMFKEHFLQNGCNDKSYYFFVRQENNSCWAKLIWARIKQIYHENADKKDPNSHELGVRIPPGALDVLARCLEFFFPTINDVEQVSKQKGKRANQFSLKMFEMLSFDIRKDEPDILEAILQRALIEREDSIMSKNAFFILNRIIAFTREYYDSSESSSIRSEGSNVFVWSRDSFQARRWEQFVVSFGAVQESQVHLVRPLLPVIETLMKEMSSGWWRVLLQRGLTNDSVPIRRIVLHAILTVNLSQVPTLCTPEGLDFCLDDLMTVGLDPNSAFFVTPQQLEDTATAGPLVDIGEEVIRFYSQLIESYHSISPAHGKAIINELLLAIEKGLRSPVALIYILKAFCQCATQQTPSLEDEDLAIINNIAMFSSLHNQRVRLLVKWQLLQVLMRFSDAQRISFSQLTQTLNILLQESITLCALTVKVPEFVQISNWLDSCFGVTFLKENLAISIGRYFRSGECSRDKAGALATLMIFSLGSEDGRFVTFTRPIFEQLSLLPSFDEPSDAIPVFTLFLALNEAVQSVLGGEDDLIAQLSLSEKLFEWLEFIDRALFGEKMCASVDFNAACTLLEAFNLFIERASENNQNQLMQFLDMHSFSLIYFIAAVKSKSDEEESVDLDVGFKRLLTIMSGLRALSSILDKLRKLGHLRDNIISTTAIHQIIRFKLERPGGLSELEWDQWPEFVTAFTSSKWKCIESMAQTIGCKGTLEDLLSILSTCLQALEVSKYGGTLSILKCMATLFDLIFEKDHFEKKQDDSQTGFSSSRQIGALFDLVIRIQKSVLVGESETQRWFDSYAESFIALLFRRSVLLASERSSLILDSLHEAFDFFITAIGPKRRGIVGLISARLGEYFATREESLFQNWKYQLMQLLNYGPIRSSADETVAARMTKEHIPDSDYQVRVHAITVLNHLKNSEHIRDLLVDLLGQQEAQTKTNKKMFPGDFKHRIKLRSWGVILLLINVLCKSDAHLSETFVENDLLTTLWRLIGDETMNSTRVFMEWSISLLYLKFPQLIETDFMSRRVLYRDVAASLVVSMLSISLVISKKIVEINEQVALKVFFPQMVDYVLPLLAHNNHSVRMYSIHAFKELYQRRTLLKLHENHDSDKNYVLGYRLLAGYIEEADHCQKFIKKLDDDIFLSSKGVDPLNDCTLDWIFGKLMKHGNVDGEAIEYYAFMNYLETEGTVPFTKDYNTLGLSSKTTTDSLSLSCSSSTKSSASPSPSRPETPTTQISELFKDFQQKIDIYSPFSLDDNSHEHQEASLLSGLKASNKLETEILVVGSLVDKLPNLAGLARTCEIFGVKTLFVPSVTDLSSPDFINVAMTADRWLDLRELQVKDVPAFLEKQKNENGFTVVALEQTSNSTPLNSFTFPKKTCLVLGNERTGIPAEILHLVDECVEIPQFGRVRSLNVHVSGSIAIWKAREQDLI